MSTELHSNTNGFATTRFFGGEDRGLCLQVTHLNSASHHRDAGFIQVTREEALLLAQDLLAFVNGTSEELE